MKLKELFCISENINVDEYIEFREYVKENMLHPEWLGDFSKEDLENLLSSNSKIWIYYLDKEPVCSMMLIPSSEKSLSKFELDLDYREVADYGPMFVNPKYVGNGLQYQMLKGLDEYCVNNKYKYVASTIHPDNVYSINNLLKDGFECKNTKEFKRGIRNIYLKKLCNIKIEYNINVSEFIEMVNSVGWNTYNENQVRKALDNTMYMVKVLIDDKLAGIGRVVGDYSIVCMLSDVCVKPEYQGNGIGQIIVNRLRELIEENVKLGEKIQIELTPTAGNEKFYQKCGFKYKPEKITGMYLWIKK